MGLETPELTLITLSIQYLSGFGNNSDLHQKNLWLYDHIQLLTEYSEDNDHHILFALKYHCHTEDVNSPLKILFIFHCLVHNEETLLFTQ